MTRRVKVACATITPSGSDGGAKSGMGVETVKALLRPVLRDDERQGRKRLRNGCKGWSGWSPRRWIEFETNKRVRDNAFHLDPPGHARAD